jgi:putative sterol carrier protein
MNFETVGKAIQEQAGNVTAFGAKLKFVVDDQVVFIDGTGDTNVVTFADQEADCTISTTAETFMKLKSGDLNPMMAVMTGKIKISGDMGLAMKLQSLL